MTVWLKKVDGVAPSSFSVDFREICPEEGPFWLSFDYWIHTRDLLADGEISAAVNWVDPTGLPQTQQGDVVAVIDYAKNQKNGVFAVQMESGTSAFTFDMTLNLNPGDSLISYRIMLQKDQCYVDWS
jgi:hypothetical protein